jgi:hypothetical protein
MIDIYTIYSNRNPSINTHMTKKYITNTGKLIDWDQVILDLEKRSGVTYIGDDGYENEETYEMIEKNGEQLLEYANLRGEESEIYKAFENSKESLMFTAFISGKDYEKEIDEKIQNLLGCKIYLSWISKVNPGKCVAPHVDDEEVYSVRKRFKEEQIVRYHIHISKPNMGAALFVENDCYAYEKQGNVYQWESADNLHCGINAGIKPKYVLHLIGWK